MQKKKEKAKVSSLWYGFLQNKTRWKGKTLEIQGV